MSKSAALPSAPPRLELLGGFRLHVDERAVALPGKAQRVLAALAIVNRAKPVCARSALVEQLWPDADPVRSQAGLRTALWRIRQAGPSLVRTRDDSLRLHEAVEVDLHRSLDQTSRLLSSDEELRPDDASAVNLNADLLPGWEGDWLVVERERMRQLRIHAIEALSDRLRACGRYGEAVDVALCAVAAEPLRESAHVALVRVYLAEGNVVEAHRQYDRYASLLWDELRLTPSPGFATRLGRLPDRPRVEPPRPRSLVHAQRSPR